MVQVIISILECFIAAICSSCPYRIAEITGSCLDIGLGFSVYIAAQYDDRSIRSREVAACPGIAAAVGNCVGNSRLIGVYDQVFLPGCD